MINQLIVDHCCSVCTKSRKLLLSKIEEMEIADPDIAQFLKWYRDMLINKDQEENEYHELRRKYHKNSELNKQMVTALRAMADKIEEPGLHFEIFCRLPEVPIFSGKDSYYSRIEITLAKYPLGG